MIQRFEWFSKTLNTPVYYLLVRPDGFEHPMPAVLLFRGAPEEWLNPEQDESRDMRTALTVLNDLIAKAYMPPLALVLPCTTNIRQDAWISYGRAKHPELIASPEGLGTGDMDRFIDEELIPHVLKTGLVLDRFAIDGFSLGGAASIYHALRRPERFVSLGSFDAALLDWEFDNPEIYPETPSDLRLDWFPYLCGYPPDEAHFRAHNPLDLIQSDFILPPAMIHHAAEEHPTANNWRVRLFLDQSEIDNQAELAMMHIASAHNWYWCDEHLYRTLPFHADYLYNF